jgi:hypothetical protein
LRGIPPGIDLLKKTSFLNNKIVIHVFFFVAIQVPGLLNLMKSFLGFTFEDVKPSRTPLSTLIT